MSALTSSFTANLVSVKSAAKKSQKVVVGVQASNEFAKKVRKIFRLVWHLWDFLQSRNDRLLEHTLASGKTKMRASIWIKEMFI